MLSLSKILVFCSSSLLTLVPSLGKENQICQKEQYNCKAWSYSCHNQSGGEGHPRKGVLLACGALQLRWTLKKLTAAGCLRFALSVAQATSPSLKADLDNASPVDCKYRWRKSLN